MNTAITITTEQSILREGVAALAEQLGTAKTARFLSAWRQGAGNYLQLRERLFGEDTVESLYDQIVAFEKTQD